MVQFITGATNVIRKWFYNPLWIGYKFIYLALFSDHNDNGDNDDSNNNGDDVDGDDVYGIKDDTYLTLTKPLQHTVTHVFKFCAYQT